MTISKEDEARYPRAASRIKEYAEKRRLEQANSTVTADLEAQIDESDRRALRLQQQLFNEASLRARAERTRDEMSDELEEFRKKLLEAEEKLNARSRRKAGVRKSGERPGDGGTVSDGVRGVDGSPASKRPRDPKPVDSSSDASPPGSDGGRKSARVRGKVN